MSAAVLEVEGLVVDYGGVRALDGVDLTVAPGEVVGLIGPNGAGKTTLLDGVCGLVRGHGGRVVVAGEDVTGLAPHRAAARGVARSFQRTSLVADLDVMANLLLGRHRHLGAGFLDGLLGRRRLRDEEDRHRARCVAVAEHVGVGGYLAVPARVLPFGVRKRVELARALAAEPRLLLLDEPTAGLAPEEADAVVAIVRDVAGGGGPAVVVVDHDLRVVAGMTDRVVALDHGRVVATGPAAAVAAHPALASTYLGPTLPGGGPRGAREPAPGEGPP